MSNPIRKVAEDVIDDVFFGEVADQVRESVRLGIKLADSDLDMLTVTKVLGQFLYMGLAATEIGRRVRVACHVLSGQPAAYRVTVAPGGIVLDEDVMAVDLCFLPMEKKTSNSS